MSENLWGEMPDVSNMRTPHAILLEQAEMLTKATKGVLVGNVTQGTSGQNFLSSLIITAPSLNYQYVVLNIAHPISIYPLNFIFRPTNTPYTIPNEAAFMERLKASLSDTRVKNVIAGLLAQISGAKPSR